MIKHNVIRFKIGCLTVCEPISTGVLGFDPEKNNHKLNFFLQAHMIILNNLSKLPEFPTLASSFKKYISKWPPSVQAEFGFANISVLETHRNLVLVAIPIFSGSRNPIKQVKITLGILVYAAVSNFKMAVTTFRPKLIFPIRRYRKLIHLILVSFPMFSGSKNPIKTIMMILGYYFGMCCHLEFHNDHRRVWTFRPKLIFPIRRYRKLIHLILVSFPMFSGSKNPIKTIMMILGYYFGMCCHLEFHNDHRRVWTENGFAYNCV